jgi:hypothetical protein
MSDHAAADHGIDIATAFSPQEWEALHKDDIMGGGMIVGLMTSIFTIGLVLYSIVAIIVAT